MRSVMSFLFFTLLFNKHLFSANLWTNQRSHLVYQIDSLYYSDNIDSSLTLALTQNYIIENDASLKSIDHELVSNIKQFNYNQIIRVYAKYGDCTNAHKYINKLLQATNDYVYCAIKYEYTNLHACPYWKAIRDSAEMQLQRNSTLNPKLLFSLLSINDKGNYNINFLAAYWDKMDSTTYLRFREIIMLKNKTIKEEVANDLDSVISLYGYPTIKNAGYDAPYIAFNIIHHSKTAILLKYQKNIDYSFKEGSIDAESYAKYIDRVLVATNCPQRYGTQRWYDEDDKMDYYFPVEDINLLNERRSALKLDPVLIPLNPSIMYKEPKQKF